MLQLVDIIGPVFLLVAIGWGAGRAGLVDAAGGRAIGTLILWVAMPVLIVRAFVVHGVTEILDARLLAIYAAASLALVIGMYALLKARGREARRAGVAAMGAAGPNSGFIGYPLVTLALGDATGAAVLANALLVENAATIPLSLALAKREGGARPLAALKGFVMAALTSNPLVGSVIVGALISLSGLALPTPVMRTMDLLSGAATPMALAAVGVALATMPKGTARRDRPLTAFAKLAVQPALVLGGVLALGMMTDPAGLGLVLNAACPMMATYPVICSRAGEETWAAATLMTAMAASALTLPLWLWGLGI